MGEHYSKDESYSLSRETAANRKAAQSAGRVTFSRGENGFIRENKAKLIFPAKDHKGQFDGKVAETGPCKIYLNPKYINKRKTDRPDLSRPKDNKMST